MKRLSNRLNRDFSESLMLFKHLQTAKDLASFLEIPLGQLLYIAYKTPDDMKYQTFTIPKKNGELRSIASPTGGLKIILEKLKPFFIEAYHPKNCAHGFIENRSIFTNAQKHKKKRLVLNIDLQDFFTTINFGRIRGLFMSPPFNMGKAPATIIAQLCTYKGVLPQGACTSPILSNLVANNLDNRLIKLASRCSITYSRYADDISLSTTRTSFPVEVITGLLPTIQLGEKLVSEINAAGFSINHRKTRILTKSDRQEVTGLTTNEFPNIKRNFIRNIRAMIYVWKKFGLNAASSKHFQIHQSEKYSDLSLEERNLKFKQILYGKLAFVWMIRGSDIIYLNFCKQIFELDTSPPKNIKELVNMEREFDIFISHASEDKEDIARPIFEACEQLQIRAFLDQVHIQWGDSLTERINVALSKSQYVLAIFSQHSIEKNWPKKEFNTALSREIDGKQIFLPLVIGDDQLLNDWPLVKEKLFKKWNGDAMEIAEAINNLLHN